MHKPDFFIVGAPRCGTTAMQAYLQQHPQIYMPAEKEIHHFATDLIGPEDRFGSRQTYFRLFEGARDEQIAGEASVFYLYSREAAANIHAFNPDAKIIIQLRNPVQWIQSYHARLVHNAAEPLTDLAEALDAEPARKTGRNVPPGLRFTQRLFYTEVGRFSEQVTRYFETFGRSQVHVILFDDLRVDPDRIGRDTLTFLGVDEVDMPFEQVNARRRPRNMMLNRWVRRPPAPVRWVGTYLVPGAIRRAVRRQVIRWNTSRAGRPDLDPGVTQRLREQFGPEIRALGRLLGRDLDAWNDI